MTPKVNRLLSAGIAILLNVVSSGARAETRALLAGVSHYQSASIPDLAGPANDLAAMTRLVRAEGASDVTVLSDAQVTRSSMEGALYELGKRSKPGDWIVLYYTGHGAQSIAAVRGTRDGDLDQFLPLAGFDPEAPASDRFIVDKDFYEWLANYVPREVNILMIADTCHSGSLSRSPDKRALHMTPRAALANWSADLHLTARPGLRFNRILRVGQIDGASSREDLPNLIYVGAAQDGQFALEMPLPVAGRPSRGLLTFAFEQGLTRRGADNVTLLADLNADGRVTPGELSIYLDSQVRALSAQQQQPRTAFASAREDAPLFVTADAAAPLPDERPRPRIFSLDPIGSEKLKGAVEPWMSLDSGDSADFVWDYAAGELLRRSGDLVAQNVLDVASVRGAVEKWGVFDELLPLINEARVQLKVMPDGPDMAYRPGQVVTVNLLTRAPDSYVTVFNLASDGTVQFIYPADVEDGDGRMITTKLEGVIEARVVRPFGVDHVVAVVSPEPQAELQTLLRAIDGQRSSARTVKPIKRLLATNPGRAGLSITEIFTQK